MRMFLYYAAHSIKNQIKKLFKTWVLVFIVACALFGGIIGVGVAVFADNSDISDESSYSEDYDEVTEEAMSDFPAEEFTELAAGLLSFAVLFLCCLGADKSGNTIFQQPDVNLLFAAPLKPQTVLLFRLMTKIGAIALSSVYIAFNIPNMVSSMGLSPLAAVGFIAAFLSILVLGQLLQVLFYVLAAANSFVKKNLRIILFGMAIAVLGGFYLYAKSNGDGSTEGYFNSAFAFFNHPATRFIPIIGCVKAFCVHIVTGNILGVVVNFLGLVLSGVILSVIIWHIETDFYEEALAHSEESAKLQAAAQEQATAIVTRKKERSSRIKRNALEKGCGANIFFYRSMYNRFRFAHFRIFTKTAETYLLTAILVTVACKLFFKATGFIPTMLIIAGLVFFRTLGNPLEEDTSKDFFRLIPEKTFNKLLWSVMAGSVNCLMDICPAVILSAVVFGINPITALVWSVFIISIDFYATNVGVFINISVPVKAGSMLKQLVQIMFIYFGLLPSVGILLAGYLLEGFSLSMIICAVFNLSLGALFLGLTPAFIDFKEKAAV